MINLRRVMSFVTLIVVVATAGLCRGETSLVLAGRGNGLFEVLGQGLEGVGGMDLTANYDPATLADPRVGQRGLSYGAMMTPNLTVPGVVRISIVTPKPEGISGTGSIAMLTFNLSGNGPGQITSFTARLISTKGAAIPVRTQILADEKGRFLGNPFSADPAPNPAGAITGTTGAAGSTVISAGQPLTNPEGGAPPAGPGGASEPGGGGRALSPPTPTEPPPAAPAEPNAPRNNPPEITGAPPAPAAVELPAPTASGMATAQQQSPRRNVVRNKSVLALVREYPGPRTVEALTTLFHQTSYPGFRQEPPIAFSDGATIVKVFLDAVPGLQSPNFALTGGKLVSIKLNGGQYLLEIIPGAGAVETTVTVLSQDSVTDYPLVVAPSLDAKSAPGGAFNEAGFKLFLKGGMEGDLNRDGRRDFLDEYIYTANYLVKGGKK